MSTVRAEATGLLLRLRVFGSMEAWSWTGENVLPRGRKTQAVLAYLALSGTGTVPRQRLASLLWSKRWSEQARASLRQSLLELKHCLAKVDPALLKIERGSVSLQESRVWIDGVSTSPGTPERPQPQRVKEFLETLRGLDPAFDEWIEVKLAALQSRAHSADATLGADPAASPDTSGAQSEGRRLTVIVTPFADLGGDLDAAHLPSALRREVVSALARFRWFTVRPGTFDEAEPVDYRVDGSVLVRADGCHIALRLFDCRTSERAVWTRESNLDRAVLQEFPDSVAAQMVEQIDPEILSIEMRAAAGKSSMDCTAYECLLRAVPLVFSFERDKWVTARTLLEQTVAKDPKIGRAYALSAVARSTALSEGWVETTEAELTTMRICAERAIELDPNDSMALALSAHAQLRLTGDFDQAMRLYGRALQYNPNCSFAWAYSAVAHGYLGQSSEATRRLSRARELAAQDSVARLLQCFSMPIHYCGGDWSETISLGRWLAARTTGVNNNNKLLVGALCQVGNRVEALEYNEEIMRHDPTFSWRQYIATYPFGREADRLSLAAAIAGAGLIDGATPALLGESDNVVVFSHKKSG